MNNDPLNLFALRAATRLAFTTGRYRLERDLLTEYAKRSPNEMTADLAKLNTDVNSLVLAAESLNLTDDLLAEIHRPLWDLLRPIGCGKDINITDLVIGDGDDCFISRTLRLPVSFEEAQALNWQWVERIAEQDEPWPIEKIIITLREAA